MARTGFGPKLSEIKALEGLSYEQAVDAILDGVSREAMTPPPAWVNEPLHPKGRVRDMSQAQRVLSLRAELGQSAQQLGERLPERHAVGEFPNTQIGRFLKQAARLILAGGMGGPAQSVIKLSLGSFDTHARQRGTQDRLLGQLAEGVAAMRLSLMRLGLWDQTLLMTYSEFGRRAKENGSGGTDHGTAAAHFMWGGRVKGGFYGQQPVLSALQQSDLVYTEDFRRLYATVVVDWWGQTPSEVLAGYRGFRCIG